MIDDKYAKGRLTPLKYLKTPQGLTLNIGSKEQKLADINIDINKDKTLTVVASALNLPFQNNTFTGVYFTEVMEHLPEDTEHKALAEIHYALKKSGVLILSTPNSGVWKLLDPAWFLIHHRHYQINSVKALVEGSGLQILTSFTGGGVREIMSNLVYCFFLYPIKRFLRARISEISVIQQESGKEFLSARSKGGTNIFVYAVK